MRRQISGYCTPVLLIYPVLLFFSFSCNTQGLFTFLLLRFSNGHDDLMSSALLENKVSNNLDVSDNYYYY
jgi:hypothetical protein